ncbi:hypothetical protein FRUB_08038 [Fimbriiglobus ruber]|uniref:Uncharacterized protein n=1 Tax=Fimbriiglobus ruber TaxID=1908690 RepID=A0A225DGE9_9BACT|nr:hypothetical protein FRUB_08038 [Fimbriiglobus ruber]
MNCFENMKNSHFGLQLALYEQSSRIDFYTPQVIQEFARND